VTPGNTDSVWRKAQSRWAEIEARDPALEPAVAVQRALISELVDAARELDRSALELQLEPEKLLEKLARGLPAFHGEAIAIPQALKDTALRLCEALATGDARDSALHIRDALASGSIETGSLLTASLARNQEAIRTTSVHHGLSPDLMWLVGELGATPLAHALQRKLSASSDAAARAFQCWHRGHCPFCGSWPALIEVVHGARTPRCSFCASAWQTRSDRCLYCGDSGDDLVAAAPDLERKRRRLDLCRRCGSYTKVIEVTALTPFPLIAIEDLATSDLDRGAMERGYGRPKMVDL
jgi:FdhE protein